MPLSSLPDPESFCLPAACLGAHTRPRGPDDLLSASSPFTLSPDTAGDGGSLAPTPDKALGPSVGVRASWGISGGSAPCLFV